MISVDTNVFVYAVDQRDPMKQSVAQVVLVALANRWRRWSRCRSSVSFKTP